MYEWIILYVLFVFALLTIIYVTVDATYTFLHQQENFVSSANKCVLFSSDANGHPWDNPLDWMNVCNSQDPDQLYAGIEALVNIGKVDDVNAIPKSNLKRIYLPIGTSDTMRKEFTKDLFDVYPQSVYVKKGYKATLTNEEGSIKKTYTGTSRLEADDVKTFKNATFEVKEIVPESEDVSADIRAFTLQGKLKSKMNSNFCVTSKKNSMDVILSECTPDYLEQKWKRDEEGRIVSLANNHCLQVQNDNTIIQSPCDSIPRQIWNTDTEKRLLAKNSSSMCMQPDGVSVVEGASLVMKDCKKGMIQHWIM